MNIQQIPVLQDNYTYLVSCPQSKEALVVDSPDAPATRNAAKKLGVELVAILNTHHHWDHIGANEGLLDKNPNLIVFGGKSDEGRIHGMTNGLSDGDTVNIGSLSFKVLDVPGHTSGHIAYYGHGALFCGDTLFVGGCGRLFEGTPEQMVTSLTKLKNLPDDTLVYCAHEYTESNLQFALTLEPNNPALQEKVKEVKEKRSQNLSTVPSTLAEEKAYNPFLRWDAPELIENVKRHYPEIQEDNPNSVFKYTRLLKDNF